MSFKRKKYIVCDITGIEEDTEEVTQSWYEIRFGFWFGKRGENHKSFSVKVICQEGIDRIEKCLRGLQFDKNDHVTWLSYLHNKTELLYSPEKETESVGSSEE